MLKLYIKSVDKTTLSLYIIFLQKIFKTLKIEYKIFSLPKKKKRISILKSPHVNKKAIEQFEFRVLKVYIIIFNEALELDLRPILINKPKNLNLKLKRII